MRPPLVLERCSGRAGGRGVSRVGAGRSSRRDGGVGEGASLAQTDLREPLHPRHLRVGHPRVRHLGIRQVGIRHPRFGNLRFGNLRFGNLRSGNPRFGNPRFGNLRISNTVAHVSLDLNPRHGQGVPAAALVRGPAPMAQGAVPGPAVSESPLRGMGRACRVSKKLQRMRFER